MTGYEYNFPPTKWADSATDSQQCEKIWEEVGELQAAIDDGDYVSMLVEAMDVICAVETLLRMHNWQSVEGAHAIVWGKNTERGYWADEYAKL